VHRLLPQSARKEPELAYLALFRSQAYNLKPVPDYELGPSAGIPLDRASSAIDRAAQFIDQIAAVLDRPALYLVPSVVKKKLCPLSIARVPGGPGTILHILP
jgi:hypothetical protein